jgi:hypothetical protein
MCHRRKSCCHLPRLPRLRCVRVERVEIVCCFHVNSHFVQDHLNSYSNAVCKDAQTAIDQYGKAGNTPLVVILLLIFLGWNEMMYLLSNPMMLIFVISCKCSINHVCLCVDCIFHLCVILVSSGAYAVYVMGMMPFIMPVFNAAFNQIMVMVNNVLSGAPAVAVAAAPAARSATSRMKKE